jgi:hypothetical protein
MTRVTWLKTIVIVLFACTLVARAVSWVDAYWNKYSPLPNAKPFPIRECSQQQNSKSRDYIYTCRSKTDVSKIMTHYSKQGLEAEIFKNGSLKARVRLNYGFWTWLDYALEGDLNRDGLPDYVLVKSSGGNGLAAEYGRVIFVLSARTGYVVTKLNTMGFNPSSLLQLGSGQANVVHSWFIYSETPTSDGRDHSFWVYHFLKIRGTKLVFDSARKPIWIQYTFKPNHTPTRLLSSAQKKRWWDKQREAIFVR